MQAFLGWLVRYGIRAVWTPCEFVSLWLTPYTSRDPRVSKLRTWRTWLGYTAMVGVVYTRRDSIDLLRPVESMIIAALYIALIAIPCLVLTIVLLVIKAGTGRRVAVGVAAARPWMTAMAVMGLPVAIALTASEFWSLPHDPVWTVLLGGSVLLWPAASLALILGVRHSLRAADVSPFLPAIVGSAIAVFTIIDSAVQAGGAPTGVDAQLALLCAGGGLMVAWLSAYELWTLSGQGARSFASALPDSRPRGDYRALAQQFVPCLVLVGVLAALVVSVNELGPVVTSAARSTLWAAQGAGSTGVTGGEWAPSSNIDPLAGRPEEQLVISRVAATSSAADSVDDAGARTTFGPTNLIDGDPATAWRAPGDASGQQITLGFSSPVKVTEVGLIPGYAKIDPSSGQDRFQQNRRVQEVRWISSDGSTVDQSFDEHREMQWLRATVITTSLTIQITKTSQPGDRDFTAISEIQIEGMATG